MGTLLLLAFALSLDSFRASLGLGATRPRPARVLMYALAFGVCDALAPLLGLLMGQSLAGLVGAWGGWLGPLLLGGYGVYVTLVTLRCAGRAEEAGGWVVWGLPLTLSLDNLVAGASLGMIQFPLVLTVLVIGAASALMSLLGLKLAGAAVTRLRVRTELVGGVCLVLIAVSLALDAG